MYREDIEERMSTALKESITYSVTMLGSSGVIVEGHRGIMSYSTEEVKIRTRKKYISILGDNLTIKNINDKDVYVVGAIHEVVLDE